MDMVSKLVYAVISRENDITALDTSTGLTELGADSPGAITVPNASKITEIRIGCAADLTADTLLGCSTGLHLSGSCGEQWIAGPVGAFAGAAATSAGAGIHKPVIRLCSIPVVPGEQINAYGFMHGEDIGSLRMMVTLVFDGPVSGPVKRFDYREADLAAANTPVTLNTRGGATEGDFKVSSGQIVEVYCGAGCKYVAGPLAATTLFVLTGNGLQIATDLQFQGNGLMSQDDIAISGQSDIVDLVHYAAPIATKKGEIRAQAQEVEDDVGTPFAIICLGFNS